SLSLSLKDEDPSENPLASLNFVSRSPNRYATPASPKKCGPDSPNSWSMKALARGPIPQESDRCRTCALNVGVLSEKMVSPNRWVFSTSAYSAPPPSPILVCRRAGRPKDQV